MAREEVTLGVGVEADASNAVRDMKQAANAAAELADAFRDIASVAVTAAKALNRVEKEQAGVTSGQKRAAQNAQEATKALQDQANAATQLGSALRNVGNVSVGNSGTKVSTALPVGRPDIGVVSKQDRDSLEATNAARAASAKITEAAITEAARRESKERIAIAAAENRQWIAGQNARKAAAAAVPNRTNVGSSFGNIEPEAIKATGAVNGLRDSLFTARFALHDISNATAVAGAALVGFNAYTVQAAADYETAMASIQRTSGATVSQVELIRQEFVGLAQEIPAGFDNLGQIGELAGQLNIPAGQISDFTEVVAQFTASTDVAVEKSATAFGRLDTLLPDVQGNYEALGSSILNVGVNSVATESEIISTTTQIAAAGAQAGFTASQVIGLAASFASLGIAPEAARGSTIRIFSEISQAVNTGSDNLDTFATLAGQSADQFRQAWSESPDTAFLSFLQGLQKEGKGAEATLREMGITGVRDINALLRLSQNVDIVTQSFSYASDGFSQATQLAEAYGITASTLNSRVDVLGQSFQAFFAEIGTGSTGPVKEFVNLLIDVLKIMTEVARNPAAQWLAIFGGIFTLLAGGVLIITSLASRMGAASIAMRTVNTELREMAVSALAANGGVGTLQTRLLSAGVAATTFGNILKGIGWATAITAGITIAITAFDAIGNAMKSNADKAKDAFGDLSGLTNALQTDTEDVANGTQRALGTVEGSLTTTEDATASWVTALENGVGVQSQLARETIGTTEAMEAYTYSIGKNTAAWLANQLANNDAITRLYKNNEALAGMGAPKADVDGLISAAAKNDTAAAKAIIDEYEVQVREFIARMGSDPLATLDSTNAAKGQLDELKNAFDVTSGALSEAASKGQVTKTVMSALGAETAIAAGEVDELGSESSTSASRLDELRQSVEGLFSTQNLIGQFGADLATLFSGIYDGGASFNELSEAGYTNLQNLQNSIASTIAAGETLGVSAAQSVAALFMQLQKQGIDTAVLLASLAGSKIPGVSIGSVSPFLNGSKQLTGNANQLTNAMNGIAASAPKASKGMSGAGKSASKAAQEVKTLKDYASDLSGVFDRAFEIRFGATQGIDKITSDFLSMRQEIDDANKSIQESQANIAELQLEIGELNATIGGLQSDNAILAYFQGIAEAYGDTLRASDIASEIAKNNAEIASTNGKIAEAQGNIGEEGTKAAEAAQAFDKNLVGNSKSAIDNRAQIIGLVANYQDLIGQYAAAGYDQTALTQKAAQLKAEFYAQAQQLGFNTAQLDTYGAAFDDVTLAISRVPRNITVTANTNPAMQALNEFVAAAQARQANVGIGSPGAGGAGYTAGYAYGDGFQNGFKQFLAQRPVKVEGYTVSGSQVYRVPNTSLQLYKSGGYTGDNYGVNDVAGMVHGQEFVVNAQNTSRLGLGFLNALNSGKTPVPAGASAGNRTQVVELSSYDRMLLARAGDVQLTIPGQAIASATNAANFVSTSRGSN